MPRKKIKKVEPIGETIRMQKGFSNRFNVPIVKSDRLHFKHRCITSIGVFVTWLSQEQIDDATTCMARLLGVHLPIAPNYFEEKDRVFEKTRIFKLLSKFPALTSDTLMYRWLMTMEIYANIDCCDDAERARKNFAVELAEAIELSGVNAILCDTPDGYRFYPANAELLDIKLVIDVLNWLNNYPKAKEKYDDALRLFLKGDRTRHVLDDCRLSLELFVKQYLSNASSLENQISELGKFLKDKNISTELRNMFNSLLKGYTSFNNNNVKHDDRVNESEIEFVIYMTGAFMRLLITSASD